LDAVIVSASRKSEKVLDAPASVSIVSSRDIENSATAVDPLRNLINVPGVQLQQQTANTLNIEMRAGAGVFGTSTFPILDYRYLVTPAAGNFLSFQSGLSNIDIDRIEVVRGSGSAMYGPGVTSGVIHFLSKSAIDKPGTTVEFMAGSMDLKGVTVRHAWASKDKKLGYKINASVRKGNDFTLDLVEDAATIASLATTVSQPLVKNKQVNNTAVGSILLAMPDLDTNGDGNPLISEFKNQSANVTVEYRPDINTSAVFAAGIANAGGLFFNSQGPGYTQGTDYWIQGRYRSGGLFAQAYYVANDGGTATNPTFLYNTGLRQVASRASTEAQIQYNFDVPEFLNTNFTIGADYRDVASDSEYTLYGRFDDDDPYTIMGGYVAGTSQLSDQVDLNYAVRYDTFNFMDEGGIAPRIALVYKANDTNTFRASYNVSTFGPTSLNQYIDFPVSTVVAGVFDVWLSGQNDIQTINSAGNMDSSLSALEGEFPANITGLPMSFAYGAVKATADAMIGNALYNQISPATLQPDPALAALAPFADTVANWLTTYTGPTGTTGSMYAYDVFDLASATAESRLPRAFDPSQAGASKSKIGYQNSIEVGYKGVWEEKLGVSIDVYTYERNYSVCCCWTYLYVIKS
jgi:iron complex outermembrane receptor protein